MIDETGRIGTAALGCLMAALFWEAGADVSLVDYRPERVARLRLRGLQVDTLDEGHRVIKMPIGLASEVGPCDLTIIVVKTYQTGNWWPGPSRGSCPRGYGPHPAKRVGQSSPAGTAGPERLLAGVAPGGNRPG